MATAFIVLFGILLPSVTLYLEFTQAMCASVFFDPIPTLAHAVAVALVPFANLAALIGFHSRQTRLRRPLLWLNGAAIGISLVYSLLFLPLTPFGLIAIIFWGMGLLPLSPLLSLSAALVARRGLLQMAVPDMAGEEPGETARKRSDRPPLFAGAGLGIAALVLLELPVPVTHLGVAMTASESPAERARGLSLLRQFGNQEVMLQMCYDDAFRPRRLSSQVLPRVTPQEARQAFFRVTGLSYNAVPRYRTVGGGLLGGRPSDEFDFDPDVGGEAVAGRVKGLSLAGSRIDAKVEPDEALAYLEWTLVFKNVYWDAREARAQIQLPPGAVVSRLTLWVNGEPREAAFAATGQVREAYQKVAVVQRRDPVLVTWVATDRVMMQCFPVPSNGQMKVRLGITAPMTLTASERGLLRLPCLVERNFGIHQEQIHAVWVDSGQPLASPLSQLRAAKSDDGRHVLRGSVSEQALESFEATIQVTRSKGARETWTADLLDPKQAIVQKIVEKPLRPAREIVVVVDGSAGMAKRLDEIAQVLAGWKPTVAVHLLAASDEVVDLTPAMVSRTARRAAVLTDQLRSAAPNGGCDNVPALVRAWELVGGKQRAAVVWIHGPQPEILDPVEPLAQALSWQPDGATLYDFPVEAGPNRVLERLRDYASVRGAPRFGSLSGDLNGLLASFAGKKTLAIERTRGAAEPAPSSPKGSAHVARLWAFGRAVELSRSGQQAGRDEAVKLAAGYHLVTPVTGAVVLENQQQYDEAKLKPADADSVPSIPEPETWALMLIAMGLALWVARRRTAAKR